MKRIQNLIILTIFSIFIIIINTNCSENSPTEVSAEENADNIGDYISKLSYNSEEMLNYQQTGGLSSDRDVLSDSTETINSGNFTILCKNTDYNLRKNFGIMKFKV